MESPDDDLRDIEDTLNVLKDSISNEIIITREDQGGDEMRQKEIDTSAIIQLEPPIVETDEQNKDNSSKGHNMSREPSPEPELDYGSIDHSDGGNLSEDPFLPAPESPEAEPPNPFSPHLTDVDMEIEDTPMDVQEDLLPSISPGNEEYIHTTRHSVNWAEDLVSSQERPSEGDNEYAVEKILDKKIDSRGQAFYLVKWEGFPSSDNSWEPLDGLKDCEQVMKQYQERRAELLANKYGKNGPKNPSLPELVDNGGAAATIGFVNVNGVLVSRPSVVRHHHDHHVDYEVNDIMGLTEHNGIKYFLISLANTTPEVEGLRINLAQCV